MPELAFPAWARWRLGWALLFGVLLLALGLGMRELWGLLLGVLLLWTFALNLRRTGYTVGLEAEGLRHGGRLYRREALRGVTLDAPWGRLWLDFGEERLSLPLGLPGWDEALAHLGVDWRGVEGLQDYLLGQRGRVWFLGALHPPREAEGVHQWALGLYRRHFRKVYGAFALAALGFLLLALKPTQGLGVAVLLLGAALALFWAWHFPHDLVRLPGGGRYNPLDPEFLRLWKEAGG